MAWWEPHVYLIWLLIYAIRSNQIHVWEQNENLQRPGEIKPLWIPWVSKSSVFSFFDDFTLLGFFTSKVYFGLVK